MEPTSFIPQHPTEGAQQLGFPVTLFGFTPQQAAYWREPGLPWRTPAMDPERPLGRNGQQLIWHTREFQGDGMAPRFPAGCRVNISPVYQRQHLQVGKVYVYAYTNAETGELEYQAGRLEKIGGNYLEARADNNPVPAIWLLRDDALREVWDVFEVTHYVSYPEL